MTCASLAAVGPEPAVAHVRSFRSLVVFEILLLSGAFAIAPAASVVYHLSPISVGPVVFHGTTGSIGIYGKFTEAAIGLNVVGDWGVALGGAAISGFYDPRAGRFSPLLLPLGLYAIKGVREDRPAAEPILALGVESFYNSVLLLFRSEWKLGVFCPSVEAGLWAAPSNSSNGLGFSPYFGVTAGLGWWGIIHSHHSSEESEN
jgi:hypothetical protein